MCGHVGFINRGNGYLADYDTWFKQALFCDSLRGRHGTGIAGISSGDKLSVYKRALAASDFLELEATKKIITGSNKALLGHNRHATQGSVVCENSHPFTHGDITLFHNGTLTSHRLLAGGNTFSVDSEAITAHIDMSTSYKEALEEIDGAYALVWYNSSDNTVNLARNDERTFYIGMHNGKDDKPETGQTVFYASEKGMLEWLCARNNIKLEKVAMLKAGVILTIPLSIKEEITDTKFTPKEPKVYENYYTAGGYYGNKGGSGVTHVGKKPEEDESKNRINIARRSNSFQEVKKYSYLLGVSSVNVKISSFKPYQVAGGYGMLCGLYNNELEIQIGGQSRQDMNEFLGKEVKVALLSLQSDFQASARIISLVTPNEDEIDDEISSTVIPFDTEKKRNTAIAVMK